MPIRPQNPAPENFVPAPDHSGRLTHFEAQAIARFVALARLVALPHFLATLLARSGS